MITQIMKMIWHQRRQNGWIMAELLLVLVALWAVVDMFVVQIYSYNRPLGYDVENCWRLTFDNYPETASEYNSDTTLLVSQGEALTVILDRLRRVPEVEEACVAFYSSPYSFGNSWLGLMPCTSDSAQFKNQSYHRYMVSVEYYDLFRIRSKQGKALSAVARQYPDAYMVTTELEKDFFGDASAVDHKVCQPGDTKEVSISAVTTSIRENDFQKPTPAMYITMDPKGVEEMTTIYGANSMEVTLRMKNGMTEEEMNGFLVRMGDQLTESNLYVNGVTSWVDQRDMILSGSFQDLGIRSLLAVFVLINVFFGITGTFWLRIEQRQAETGLRMALGSTKRGIGSLLTAEGWLLLTGVVPLALILLFNIVYMELNDVYNLAFTWWRFLIGFGGTLLLMGGMITLGTWLPARRAMRLQPAEALHYE